MKQLPDEKELAELVEMARITAGKARAMSELAERDRSEISKTDG